MILLMLAALFDLAWPYCCGAACVAAADCIGTARWFSGGEE